MRSGNYCVKNRIGPRMNSIIKIIVFIFYFISSYSGWAMEYCFDRQALSERWDQYRALMNAVSENKVDEVRRLLQQGYDPDICSEYGWTPLMQASSKGYLEMVKLLLDWKADSIRQDIYQHSALYWAEYSQYTAIINILSSHKKCNKRPRETAID